MQININAELEEKIKPLLNQRYNAAFDWMESSYKDDARLYWKFYNGELPKPYDQSMIPAMDRTCYTIVENAHKDLVEIFTSGEDVVSFAAVDAKDSNAARASTQLVNQIFLRDNNGKSLLQDALRTCLIEGNAIFKAYWSDDEFTTHTVRQSGIEDARTIQEYLLGLRETGIDFKDEDSNIIEEKDGTYTVSLTYRRPLKKVKVDLIPIEEFGIEPGAKTIQDSDYICHRVKKTKEQLKALGMADDEISEINDNQETELSAWGNNAARTNYRQNMTDDKGDDSDDPAFEVWLKEHHWRTGVISDDGSVRIYKILQVNDGKILKVDEEFSFPFIVFNPIPIPQNIFGYSLLASVVDIQCDLAWAKQALHTYAHKAAIPNYFGVAGEYDERDLMNPAPGTVFRVQTMGALQLAPTTPLPPIDSIFALGDKEKQERTGINSGVSDLTTNGLENARASETSMNNMITLAQGRPRQMAHCLANGGYTELFKSIYNLYKDNSDRPINVLTAYGVAQIHPQDLPERDHVVINVAMTTQEKLKKANNMNLLIDFMTKIMAMNGEFIGTQQKAWMIQEYGNYLGLSNTYDFSVPLQMIQPAQPDPMMIAQLQNIDADTELKQAQAQKLVGEDNHANADLLFKQQLAAKQESRKDLELKFQMGHDVDQLNHKTNELTLTANVEAQKAQHNNRRQMVEEQKAATANLKVNADIIQRAKEMNQQNVGA